MRVILLDYGGTLNQMMNPTGFVQWLVSQGDFPVLFTGTAHQVIDHNHPRLRQTVKRCLAKGRVRLKDLPDPKVFPLPPGETLTEVVLVDDEYDAQVLIQDLNEVRHGGATWRFLHAQEILTLLRLPA